MTYYEYKDKLLELEGEENNSSDVKELESIERRRRNLELISFVNGWDEE